MQPTEFFRSHHHLDTLAGLLLCFFLAPSLLAKAVVDFDPTIDFSKYKTWTYIGGVGHLVNATELGPDHGKRAPGLAAGDEPVRIARGEGERKSGPGDSLWANSSSRLNVAGSVGWGMYAPYLDDRCGFLYNQINVTTTREGALVIDLLDTHTKALTWRLYVTMKILNNDPQKTGKQADSDIAKTFKSYPPSPKEVADMQKEWEKEAGKKQKSTGLMGP